MDLLHDLQNIFFKEVSKEEALRIWHDEINHQIVVILWDDLTESVIEDEQQFDTGKRFGITLSQTQIDENKSCAYGELYNKLQVVKSYGMASIEEAINEVMGAINYIEALGF